MANHLSKKFESTQTTKPSIHKSWNVQNINNATHSDNLKQKKLVIYIYSLSYNLVKEVISKLGLSLIVTKEIKQASLIIGLKSHLQQNQKLQRLAEKKNIPIYKVNRNSVYQVVKLIQFIML